MIDFKCIKIAVDFDGTIVEHAYPGIGKEKLFAFRTLKELEKMGARLILWTFRNGKELEEAVSFCKQNGIEFYAVNRNYPEEVFNDTVSRKIDADIYIDDKNIGGFPGWSEVWQMLNPYELHEMEAEKRIASARKNILKDYLNGKQNKMKNDYPKYLISMSMLLLLAWMISCSGSAGKRAEAKSVTLPAVTGEAITRLIKMVSPEENTGFKLNDQVKVILEPESKNKLPDSILISFDGKLVKTLKSGLWEYTIPSSFSVTTGRKSLKAAAYREGKLQNTITRFMIIYSDVVPKRHGYKVVHVYPHDREAFTQGLFYDNGVLYEGTGQESGSSLREVELETGKIIRQHNLDRSLFGEGITLYHDRIYEVTWRNKVGFIYDKSTFNLINKIYYPMEGWGLTTIGDRIVLSDGTDVIYFFEPEMFTVVSRIEIYDNKEKVDSLNELEYINGEIWANIWMTDRIARIDPATGKVLGYIDLKGILNDPDTDTKVKVLNGIAFDKENDRIFVTGKNWPKLFEIKITE